MRTSEPARTGGTGVTGRAGDSRERILAAATRAFAARGYEGVSIRELAAEVELDVATVQYHVGRKAELYAAVLARLQARELHALEDAVAGLDDATLRDPALATEAVLRAVDGYLDFLVAEPAVAALWVRCWVDEPPPIPDVWQRFARPQYQLLEERFAAGVRAGTLREVDAHLVLRTLVWTTHGYLTGGVPGSELDPRDAAQLASFRGFLHELVRRIALRSERTGASGPAGAGEVG